MDSPENKDYVVVVQCHIVQEHCSGYFCEKAFHERTGGFAPYPKEKPLRMLSLTCGGCCGRAVQRKLMNLITQARKSEGIERDRIVVQLSSCITKNNHHGPPCPHLDYLRAVIARTGLDVREDTRVSALAEKRRREGLYD
ncbi:MAG: CGGC domain-containing protein [Armatimonadetes bacterium]|nr:CGGC domain-containing protein [Armatimonadota bacterium]